VHLYKSTWLLLKLNQKSIFLLPIFVRQNFLGKKARKQFMFLGTFNPFDTIFDFKVRNGCAHCYANAIYLQILPLAALTTAPFKISNATVML